MAAAMAGWWRKAMELVTTLTPAQLGLRVTGEQAAMGGDSRVGRLFIVALGVAGVGFGLCLFTTGRGTLLGRNAG